MRLELKRKWLTDVSTIGELSVDGMFTSYSLEDALRDVKIAGRTAIPAGEYEVVLNWSNRFKRVLPLLLYVPNFSGVRIHPGNTAADTEGCILVGLHRGENVVRDSREAFGLLLPKLTQATQIETITISIS